MLEVEQNLFGPGYDAGGLDPLGFDGGRLDKETGLVTPAHPVGGDGPFDVDLRPGHRCSEPVGPGPTLKEQLFGPHRVVELVVGGPDPAGQWAARRAAAEGCAVVVAIGCLDHPPNDDIQFADHPGAEPAYGSGTDHDGVDYGADFVEPTDVPADAVDSVYEDPAIDPYDDPMAAALAPVDDSEQLADDDGLVELTD